MKNMFSYIILSLMLASCGSTKVSTGPSGGIGPIQVGLYVNSDGEIEAEATISIPIVANKDLGAGINWDITFTKVLNEAQNKTDYLIVLWDDGGSIREQDFQVGRPFEINFAHDQWVRKIKRLDNGSIVVFVEKQELVKEVPNSDVNSSNPKTKPTATPVLNGYWCDDLSGVHLSVGDQAKITWDKVNLRSTPKVPDVWDANIVAQLENGTPITIIDGPVCAHEGTWWKVQTADGKTGWMREFISAGYLLGR